MIKSPHAILSLMLPRHLHLPLLLALAWGLACAGSARGEAAFSLEPAGSGTYIIVGTGMEKIAALDFTVTYDAAKAGAPQVVKGPFIPADASFFYNTAIPGELRIMITRNMEIAGSGTLATISFEKAGTVEPRILSFKSNPISVTASPLDVFARNAAVPAKEKDDAPAPLPAEAAAEAPASDRVPDSTTAQIPGIIPVAVPDKTPSPEAQIVSPPSEPGPTYTGTPVHTPTPQQQYTGASPLAVTLGSVTMPGEQRTGTEKENQDKRPAPPATTYGTEQLPFRQAGGPESRTAIAEPSPPATPQPVKKTVYQSVLDRMKEYNGERSPAALTALFNPVPGQKVRQEPPVAISDGESGVIVSVDAPPGVKETPTFSFRNANMVSLEQSDDGSWRIGLIPRKNALEARITVILDGNEIIYPLVVSPPIDPAILSQIGPSETVFNQYLKQQGSGRERRFDLNGDGRYDYLDDYIFTAHYLATRQKPVR